jgi:AhpC/TSA family protein
MKKNLLALLGILFSLAVLFTFTYGQEGKAGKAEEIAEGPQVGQPAPDFEVPWADQTGIHTAKNEWVKLSSLRGSNVILAFYVADWTGG